MILRKSALCSVRVSLCHCRSISMSGCRMSDDRRNLPSRKLFDQLTDRAFIDEQLSQSGRKPFEVMLEKPIIIKNFFISEIESKEIEYPDFRSIDHDKWKSTNAEVLKCLKSNESSQNQLEHLKKLHLFGYNVPKVYGGLDYTHTECTLASEIEHQNIDFAFALNSHRLVCQTIKEYGSTEQCAKYLTKLATGELVGTTALEEWDKGYVGKLKTQAEYYDDDEEWCLNGTKSFVINAAKANVFIVLAETEVNNRQGDKKNSQTMFIVDSNSPGVKIHEKDNTIGLTNSYQATVTFKDVMLSKDAVLLIPGTGHDIQFRLDMISRLNQGISNLIQMKTILQYMLNMAESVEHETNHKSEAITLRTVLGQYSCSIYALESMLYLTTGIMDKYENTNIDLETAIISMYSQEQLVKMSVELLSFVDSRVMLKNHPMNEPIRNAIQMRFNEPNNGLKLHIGREGYQYRVHRLIEEVKLKKNKEFVMKNFLTEKQLDMYEPALQESAKQIFDSIELLRLGASTLIRMESTRLNSRETEIRRLADSAAFIYGSYACLLRVDKALKLNLPNAHNELVITQAVCHRYNAEIKQLMQYIQDGPKKTFEAFHEYVTYLMLQPENKFPVHPLTRLF